VICYDKNWCQPCNSKHFKNDFGKWTSDNIDIDNFIQKIQLAASNLNKIIEWIPYHKLRYIKYITKGGFGSVYSAFWLDGKIINWDINNQQWSRIGLQRVALKSLNNSSDSISDILKEVESNIQLGDHPYIIQCFGISQDPKTKNFMMVMDYFPDGSMSQYLKNNYNKLSFDDKLRNIFYIAKGLKAIHSKEFIHKDLHSGNILSMYNFFFITDLGLCKPVNEQDKEKKIFGVLPYIAPEVLRGKTYTQAADIYSFGILACEILSGLPPYHNLPMMKLLY
jgi:serine/threonine protein kinase